VHISITTVVKGTNAKVTVPAMAYLVETESIIAFVFWICKDVLLWQARFFAELFCTCSGSDGDEYELHAERAELRKNLLRELACQLPAEESPETPPEHNDGAFVRAPQAENLHLLAIGSSEDSYALQQLDSVPLSRSHVCGARFADSSTKMTPRRSESVR